MVQISYLEWPIQQASYPLQQEACMCYQFFRLHVLQPLSLLVYPAGKYKQLFFFTINQWTECLRTYLKCGALNQNIEHFSSNDLTFTTTFGRSSFNCCIVWYMELFFVSSAVICTIQSPIKRICCKKKFPSLISQHLQCQSSGFSDITPCSNANNSYWEIR